MTTQGDLSFVGRTARRQYLVLMALFRIAVNRYLFGIFTRFLARRFDPANAAILTLPTGGKFKIYLNDGYWTRFALFRREYEPEVGTVIDAAAGHTALFCDAGANKGYWSVYASTLFQRVIAIEASSDTFRTLTENTRSLANVHRCWAAVFSRSNEELSFVNVHNSHASARLGDTAGTLDRTEVVETVAIDDLLTPGQAALIKLDVEGAEIAAMDGARRALRDGSVLIYEDHGGDAACAPSAHLLGLGNIRVYFAENPTIPLHDVASIRALKTDPYKGYNFIAAHHASPLLTAILEDFANR
ncbi:MAG: FkbM family methyltransferase [Pseudomonadota bacterium]